MSNCERMEADLVTYLDAKANQTTRQKVEAHLVECASCRQRVAEFRALWGVLDELPPAMPSAAFDAGVRARIAAEPERRAWWRVWVPSPRLAFAATVLVALSLWIVTIPQTPAPADAPLEVAATAPSGSEADFRAIQNLPELENYDLLSNFDALSDLPSQATAKPVQAQ